MTATKAQLVELRQSTYRVPDEPRCGNCRHYSTYGQHCAAIVVRGKLQWFNADPNGHCDLHEPKGVKT